jgi:UDP-glucose 4-epimerase
MRVVVTGSAGHLGEALMRTLPAAGYEPTGLDVLPSPFTHAVGSITDRSLVRQCMHGVDAVIHSATLHKPHVATHSRQDFVEVNIAGTLTLLEEAVAAGVKVFIFTSTTSTFGRALVPPPGAPAAWITEDVVPVPKNIYGVTKVAAESLCDLLHQATRLPCLILRTSRFFPEADDSAAIRATYVDANAKANEFLHRRVDVEDVVSAHACALERAASIGFGRYIISATTPFGAGDLAALRVDAPAVVRRLVPRYEEVYARRGWTMFPSIDRVYANDRARHDLGWVPRHDFASVIDRLAVGQDPRSELARTIGSKGYHEQGFEQGPYPVE